MTMIKAEGINGGIVDIKSGGHVLGKYHPGTRRFSPDTLIADIFAEREAGIDYADAYTLNTIAQLVKAVGYSHLEDILPKPAA